MFVTNTTRKLIVASLLSFSLSGCYQPPYNNFRPYNHMPKSTAKGAGFGVTAGAFASAASSGLVPPGAVAGTVVGGTVGLYKDSKLGLVKQLQEQDIQFIEYGDRMTLIIPVDRYYIFNTPRLNDLNYPGLTNVVKLLKLYPRSAIYVAGFTDNIGSHYHKKMMSQAQAETMLTYLWANDIQARRISAEGYSEHYDVAENKIIHGSAQNRRIEIQWFNSCASSTPPMPYLGMTK